MVTACACGASKLGLHGLALFWHGEEVLSTTEWSSVCAYITLLCWSLAVYVVRGELGVANEVRVSMELLLTIKASAFSATLLVVHAP
jgi:hypothetical protein